MTSGALGILLAGKCWAFSSCLYLCTVSDWPYRSAAERWQHNTSPQLSLEALTICKRVYDLQNSTRSFAYRMILQFRTWISSNQGLRDWEHYHKREKREIMFEGQNIISSQKTIDQTKVVDLKPHQHIGICLN